ncbi:bifunctional 4-hydroxy-2-oxoglutarate aldolase/2-dehydro-3-deoxy-phosphogluconate aldolase [Sporosarcina saromensis]|uniref:Bifunctional 4-hydroxy-2-oxoglutarate aldolase/2-dehydro-3-deoxy-phosphogluconate aldolase n=1 Tax=Sporosarcina saromensis TaxID=359365 RepID=A0ABU4G7X9_9BACL|nr:bifunctional 4-hydroxy-2-oxoglutarate aldolase/2-dehydro-3-deoxy-phosphogluconate aldolase [Sporosarcina saromensis]MDW0113088.1 bifunctional 4-hydroxy-2-oxoglutarate aldolase/2-dehydro-3-deoxy-phosphogluconate aldolase [Sporosarcina saromensis]
MNQTLKKITDNKIIAILRRLNEKDIYKIVDALVEGDIQVIEITADTENILPIIENLKKKYATQLTIGVGTVLHPDRIASFIQAGASFILSPNVNEAVIQHTKKLGAISIPGAFTPSEIVCAYEYGADIVKVFPANRFGPSYIKDLQAPLPHIPLLPTGGIDETNIGQYLQMDCAGFGVSSGLHTNCMDPNSDQLKTITETAKKLVEQAQGVRRNA